MATASKQLEESRPERLYNGDRITQKEYHRIYCQMPEDYRAELIGGIVFEPSPATYFHGSHLSHLAYLLESYSVATPGTGVAGDATLILSDEDEPQPDLMLRISEEHGGQSRISKDGYVEGAPELVAEIAYSSRAIDLHLKRERYALAGVIEYLVVCLEPERIYWFDLRSGTELQSDRKGIIRSQTFPGLWIHEDGLLKLDRDATSNALKRGLKTSEHKEFVAGLATLSPP
ncbi:MAG TPA: Uma2 family endonuclease [Candidatus Obscuribacterales bacterium]